MTNCDQKGPCCFPQKIYVKIFDTVPRGVQVRVSVIRSYVHGIVPFVPEGSLIPSAAVRTDDCLGCDA